MHLNKNEPRTGTGTKTEKPWHTQVVSYTTRIIKINYRYPAFVRYAKSIQVLAIIHTFVLL